MRRNVRCVAITNLLRYRGVIVLAALHYIFDQCANARRFVRRLALFRFVVAERGTIWQEEGLKFAQRAACIAVLSSTR